MLRTQVQVVLVKMVDSMVLLVVLMLVRVLLLVDYHKEKVVVKVELLYVDNTLRHHY